MDKFIIEYSISPPFLERNLKETEPSHKLLQCPRRMCSAVYIRGIKSLDGSPLPQTLNIKGYQENAHTRFNNIDMKIVLDDGLNRNENRILSYGCFDVTHFNIIANCNGNKKFYSSTFSGCETLRYGKVLLYELKLFAKNTFFKKKENPSYQLDIKAINFKTANKTAPLHYNWIKNKKVLKSNECLIDLNGIEFVLSQPICVFCFKTFENIENLCFHINNLHYNYKAQIELQEDKKEMKFEKKLKILRIYLQEDEESRDIDEELSERVFAFKNTLKKRNLPVPPQESFFSSRERNYEFDHENGSMVDFRYYYARKICEIVDVKEKYLDLMIQWNDFVRLKREKGKLPSLYDLAEEFVLFIDDKCYILDLMILLYQKGLLFKSQIIQILSKKFELSKSESTSEITSE